MSTMYTWPDYYPAGCPPEDATEATGFVYFFVNPKKAEKNIKDCFVCHARMHPDLDFGDKICESCGLSVSKTPEDAIRSQGAVPQLQKKKLLFANLPPGSGKIQNTPRSFDNEHHTWWLPIECEKPWLFFAEVQKELKDEHPC